MKRMLSVSRFPRFEALIVFGLAASTVLLTVTGFSVASLLGGHLTGYFLLAHTGCGGLFAACLAAFSLLRVEAYSFGDTGKDSPFSILQKVCFWLMSFLGIVLILSIIVAMFPILGTEGQHVCVATHRIGAQGAVLVTVLYSLVSLRRS